ncbi:MAG TPA: N-acetylmuramoyl-L-alanine amidase-like domain-containing protein [Gemmatimonadales bacterium]|nr:N-acetylmuramoyl-L-alanine amidase-like domain-containing protein [Gemmatimonadales bacterium]
MPHSRRDLLRHAALGVAALVLPTPLLSAQRTALSAQRSTPDARPPTPDEERLTHWTTLLRTAGLADCARALGAAAVQVGEYAEGSPYEAYTLEAYLKAGGSPLETEPLTLSLAHFDCVTLVESCLAVARCAATGGTPTWEQFGREIERMRYRDGVRKTYASRLHYFSEWISDGQRRGLVRDMGPLLGAIDDTRPLRFMTEHRKSYPALSSDAAFGQVGEMERSLDNQVRHVVPTEHIPVIADQIQSGDILAFATSIPGLDVTHAALAYRHPDGRLGVLHAPLSGGVVEVSRYPLPDYVSAIKGSTGILVARGVWGL